MVRSFRTARPMSSQSVGRIDCRRDGDVATVTICNERKLNAMTVAMWAELKACFDELGMSETLRCIVVRGAGAKAFSAGADISEFETTRSTREQVVRFHEDCVGACLASMLDCEIPIVSAIHGVCMGGGLEIACATDIRLADERARFGAPVGKLGFPLAFGETQALFSVVGQSVAAELLIEGRVFSAAEALSRGVLTRVSLVSDFERNVADCVRNICESGRWAARSHKRQLRRLMRDRSPVTEAERFAVYAFADTEEYQEGYRVFLARKKNGSV